MLSAEIVTVVAKYFQVHAIIMCLTMEEIEDASVNERSMQLAKQTTKVFFNTGQVKVMKTDHEKVLILPNEECVHDAIKAYGLRQNAVWLSENSIIEPPSELRLDSQWITCTETGSKWNLQEHYRVKKGLLITNALGYWKNSSGLHIKNPNIWERRQDLNGIALINSALTWTPMNIVGNGSLDGYIPSTLKSLERMLNFTHTLTSPEDKEWGVERQNENGTYWSGMVGQLTTKDADLSTGGLTITDERQNVIDFTVEVCPELFTLIVPKAQGGVIINSMAYLEIFTLLPWIAILITGLAYSMFIILHAETLLKAENYFEMIIDSIGQFSGSLVQFSIFSETKALNLSQKILVFTISAFGLLIFSFFVGDLTAKMTAGAPTAPLRSLNEVIKQGYTLLIHEGTAAETKFKNSPPDSSMAKAYNSIVKKIPIYMYTQLPKYMLETPKTATYIVPYSYLNDERFHVVMDFQERIVSSLGIGLQKDSEFKAIFDYHIDKIKESGIFTKEFDIWILDRKMEDKESRIFVEEPISLGYDNLFFPSSVLMLGIFASFMLMIYEAGRNYSASQLRKWHGKRKVIKSAQNIS